MALPKTTGDFNGWSAGVPLSSAGPGLPFRVVVPLPLGAVEVRDGCPVLCG
jgi:hypothetical protein